MSIFFKATRNILPDILLTWLFPLSILQSSGVGTPVILRVDENGFFLYWADQTTKVKSKSC